MWSDEVTYSLDFISFRLRAPSFLGPELSLAPFFAVPRDMAKDSGYLSCSLENATLNTGHSAMF